MSSWPRRECILGSRAPQSLPLSRNPTEYPIPKISIQLVIPAFNTEVFELSIAHNDGVILRTAKQSITEDADGKNDALVTFEGFYTLVRRARVPDLQLQNNTRHVLFKYERWKGMLKAQF